MALNSDNQLKFDEGKTTEPLTIMSAALEDLEFGSKFVVHIKPTIEGYDHFIPSQGLVKKMKESNVDVDDIITIEKVAPSDKYKYGYFGVKVVEKNAKGNKVEMDKHATGEIKPVQPMHKSDEKFIEQFKEKPIDPAVHDHPLGVGFAQKDDKAVEVDLKAIATSFHELSIRVENLEAEVLKLKKGALPF